VITPPDVVSQLLLALPMVALYEAGILASSALARSRGAAARSDRRA
jgi:sec-independent protein translocase protein TatC